jgi:hypothetical protein
MSSRAAALLSFVITMLLAISSVHASALTARLQAPPVAPASAQTILEGITVTVTAARALVEVGEPIEFTIRFEGESAASARIDIGETLEDASEAASDDTTTAIEPDSNAPVDPSTNATPVVVRGTFDVLKLTQPVRDDAGVWTAHLMLSCYDAGTITPPSITVQWMSVVGSDAQERDGLVALPTIIIQSIVGETYDSTQFRDIRGTVEIIEPWQLWLWIISTVVVIAIVVCVVYFLTRPKPIVPIPAHVWALSELTRIEAQALPAKGEFGGYYDALTAVVRTYIARRYEIPADRQTTREFLRAAQTHHLFPATQTEQLRHLLRLADLVKFASATAERSECDLHLAQARALVELTREVTPLVDDAATNRAIGSKAGVS